MNTKHLFLTAAISLALAGNADAGIKERWQNMKAKMQEKNQPQDEETTLPPVEVKGTKDNQVPVDQQKTMKAAGVGAGIGAGIGSLFGVDPRVGAAVGGLAGGFWSYKKQIKQAREVEEAAREAGMDASVSTEKTVDEKGKTQETLAALTIRYDAADMEAMEPKTVAMLDRLASLAVKSKATLTIRFEGKKACQIPLAELDKRHALDRHKVVNACGKSPQNQIVVSPLPISR